MEKLRKNSVLAGFKIRKKKNNDEEYEDGKLKRNICKNWFSDR